jgi:hypothetical protein
MLCILNHQRHHYLVVGVTRQSQDSKNEFGNKFERAIENTQVKVKYDSFESQVIEIQEDDFVTFIEQLCNISS